MAGYQDPYGETRGFGDVNDPDPGDPDSLAQRRTPAWRDAFNKHREWIEGQVALRGGAGDAEKTKQILGQLGIQNVKEKGMHAYTDAEEIAGNARGMMEDAQSRQHWRGGAGGRPLEANEMSSLQELTGWQGGNTNIPPEILKQWQGKLRSGGTGPDVTSQPFGPAGANKLGGGYNGTAPNYNAQNPLPGQDAPNYGGWGSVYNPPTPGSQNPSPIPTITGNPVYSPLQKMGPQNPMGPTGPLARRRMRRPGIPGANPPTQPIQPQPLSGLGNLSY